MKTQTNEIHAPLQITINGESVTAGSWEAKLTDPEDRPRYGDVYWIEESISNKETDVILHFRGEEAMKIRRILDAVLNKQNAKGDSSAVAD